MNADTLSHRYAILSDRGHAVRAVYTLLTTLRVLDDDSRRDVLELLAEELNENGLAVD